jgi:hypothetical protein
VFSHPLDLNRHRIPDLGQLALALNPPPAPTLTLWPAWCAARLAWLPAREDPDAHGGEQTAAGRDRAPARPASSPVSNGRLI